MRFESAKCGLEVSKERPGWLSSPSSAQRTPRYTQVYFILKGFFHVDSESVLKNQSKKTQNHKVTSHIEIEILVVSWLSRSSAKRTPRYTQVDHTLNHFYVDPGSEYDL